MNIFQFWDALFRAALDTKGFIIGSRGSGDDYSITLSASDGFSFDGRKKVVLYFPDEDINEKRLIEILGSLKKGGGDD